MQGEKTEKRIGYAMNICLDRGHGGREISRVSKPGHAGVAQAVDHNGVGAIVSASSQISKILKSRSVRFELGDKCIAADLVGAVQKTSGVIGLKRARRDEVLQHRQRLPGDIGAAGGIDRDIPTAV